MTGGWGGHDAVALGTALVATLGYGSASVLQALGARRAAPGQTVRHPLYVAGVGIDVVAWLVSLVALRTLPVYEVQAVLAGSVAVTAVLARLLLGASLRRVEAVAVVASIAGIAVLALASAPSLGAPDGRAWTWLLVVGALAVAVIGLAVARGRGSGALAALLAGVAYGGTAVCAQEMPLHAPFWSAHTVTTLATSPLSYAFVVYAVAGMGLYAYALEHAEVGPATALLWTGEVIAPALFAAAVLHERFRAGWDVAGVLGVATILAAALVLSRVEPATTAPTASPALPAAQPD